MLLSKIKKLVLSLMIILFSTSMFAITTDLSARFLDKANEAYEADNVEDAYRYVNQALAVSKDEEFQANVLYFAQTVYAAKLQKLLDKYDDMAMIDINMNIERYPDIENTRIKKLIAQIEQSQVNKEKAVQKAEAVAQKKIEQERFEAQQQAIKEQANAIKEQSEANLQSQQEFRNALETGLKDMGSAFTASAEETKRSTKVIGFSVVGIALIIVLLVFVVIMIIRKASKTQQEQQAQYVHAFKMLAANQNQTNRLMLGGVTDLYGSDSSLRLAGSSTWASAQAIPDMTFSEEDQEELKKLAIKCEEIGQQIDYATGRKNNSKNVSELVYKLSNQLGLPQGMCMLNFCAAMIYDAGFLGIDPDLLSAKSLSEEEKAAMKEHVKIAEKYLDFVPKKYWSVFEDAAMKHHENIDGSGYPNGLSGEQIPQIARLIRVAESYVSLSSKRSYRNPMDKETAVAKLKEQPELYDIDVVEALDKIV